VVSLIRADGIVSAAEASQRDYSGELAIMSVGRLDTEKNPLLLVEVLARLEEVNPGGWRLRICGEGPAEDDIRKRLAEAGLEDRCDLLGYVSWGEELERLYRGSHALLHISRTEGFPQVLIEAFAAGLPVVATAVGGIAEAVGEAAALIPPDDPNAAVRALDQIRTDHARRNALVEEGLEFVSARTLDAEAVRVASFIGGGP
jgi:glycosyltransferase involved in cell wall biosynthesis